MYEVRLPAQLHPTFPRKCIRCETAPADHEIRVGTISTRWWSPSFWGFGPRVGAPACQSCERRARWLSQLKVPVAVAVAVLGCGSAVALPKVGVEIGDKVAAGLFWGGILLGLLIPMWLWEEVFPRSFYWEVVSNWPRASTHIGYQFRSKEYASEFAALNHASIERW